MNGFDPGVVHAVGDDFHLSVNCIGVDAGDPGFTGPVTARDGDARVLNGRTDIGWDERP